MRMWCVVANAVALGGIAWMVLAGGIEIRAAEVLPHDAIGERLEQLEQQAGLMPGTTSLLALAGAYLDRDQPGLASAVIEHAPLTTRTRPDVAHLYARALLMRGRSRAALAIARDANEACAEPGVCAAWLVAKLTRQASFLEQVVAAGVDDPRDSPLATRAACERSGHEVRLVAMR